MESVLSERNLILKLSLKVDEKKQVFFSRRPKDDEKKKTCFLRRSKVESFKVRFGPERTDSILLKQTNNISYSHIPDVFPALFCFCLFVFVLFCFV